MRTGYTVSDLMTTKPIIVPPSASVAACAGVMAKKEVSTLLVGEQGKLLGIVSEQDIIRQVVAQGKDPMQLPITAIMRSHVYTIPPHVDIFEALMKMRELNIRHLPVLDDQVLVGLLTLNDILRFQPQLFELLADKLDIREEERKRQQTEQAIFAFDEENN